MPKNKAKHICSEQSSFYQCIHQRLLSDFPNSSGSSLRVLKLSIRDWFYSSVHTVLFPTAVSCRASFEKLFALLRRAGDPENNEVTQYSVISCIYGSWVIVIALMSWFGVCRIFFFAFWKKNVKEDCNWLQLNFLQLTISYLATTKYNTDAY